MTGVEIPGVYDGVAYWECDCGKAWHRFHAGDDRRVRLERAMATWPQSINRPVDHVITGGW